MSWDKKGRALSDQDIQFLVELIRRWIEVENEMGNFSIA
jgi:hypothetical protein